MDHPTTRVLAALELLQSRQRLGGAELAERLAVDGRTVRRYITILQDLGIPVEAERGRYGGYRLRPGFKLPPLMFSDDEAQAVVLGLLAARQLGLTAAAPAVEGALAKLGRVLPAALRVEVQAVQDALALDLPPADAPPAGDTVRTFSLAAQARQPVWLRYRSGADAAVTERLFDPYGVVYRAGRWYTVGYCHLRADLRTFRLDRVLAAELRDGSFLRPPGFDSLAFLLETLVAMPGAWAVEVLLETTLGEARRRVSPALAALTEEPGGVLLRCYVQDLPWLARYLAGLPWPFVVRQPPELRAALRDLAADITALAARGEAAEERAQPRRD